MTSNTRVSRIRTLAGFLALLALAGPLPAQSGSQRSAVGPEHVPNIKPTLEIGRAPGPITIDGLLGDSGWVGAARATNWSEHNPRERARPSVHTEVWVTYDAKHLYVAFIAHDDPSQVRSSLTDRDRIFQDDYIGILLDTYGDASWAYFLFANPKGIQADSRFAENRDEDERFDIIYHSRGRITEDGYVVEMAIPFASLRFPSREVQTWRATFWRNRPRASREQISWAALTRNDSCSLCQLGTITGLQGIKPGGSLEVIPSVVGSQSGALATPGDPASGFANRKVDGEAGVTARYSFASGLTAEATINPDFSQVESDVAQVDVNTTFALFFPERRPFFQEGSDLFDTWINSVYTRSINDPLVAGKLIGRLGRTTVAYLGARDEHSPLLLPFEERSASGLAGKSFTNVVRARRTFGRNSFIGALVTDRRLDDGGSGSLAGVDAMLGFGGVYQIEFQLAGTRTVEPDDPSLLPSLAGVTFDRGAHTASLDGERFTGYAQYTSFERSGRTWNFDFDYWAYSPTFRAENGFESRNDVRRVSMFQGLNFYPGGLVERFGPSVFVGRVWNFGGERKSQQAEAQFSANLRGQTFVYSRYRIMDERFRGVDFQRLDRFNLYLESTFSQPLAAGIGVSLGDGIARNLATPVKGTGLDLEAWARIRPASWVTVNPSFTHSRLDGPDGERLFSGYILRTRSDLQFTRELFLRLVVQYNDFARSLSAEPLLTYRANPFTLVYLGSTRSYQDFDETAGWTRTGTQYFAKVQYLIRR